MRTLSILILLFMGGCSTADFSRDDGAGFDEIKVDNRILQAEYDCAGVGLAVGTIAYDKCLDDKLKTEPALKAQLDLLRARFAEQAADGTLDASRQCSNLGYGKGADEYNICLEYARENSKNKTGNKR